MNSKRIVTFVIALILLASGGLLAYLATRPRDHGPVITDPRALRDFEQRGIETGDAPADPAKFDVTPTPTPDGPDTTTDTDAERSDIDALIRPLAERVLDAECVPSLAVGVIRDGRSFTFGYADPDDRTGAAPDADTIFEIGSISKVFTGALLAEAVRRAEVRLDQPLDALLPNGIDPPRFPTPRGTPTDSARATGADGVITLAMLARHISGLPRLPLGLGAGADPYKDFGHDDLMNFINGRRLTRAPGASYEYSNLGVGLLGTLLADAAHTSYADLLRERITEPLGMDRTSVAGPDASDDDLTPGHAGGRPVGAWHFGSLAPAGAIRSCVGDMLRFADACLNATPESYDGLGASLLMAMDSREQVPGISLRLGLGWHESGDRTAVWHNGRTGGYSTMLLVSRDRRLAVVVLANGADDIITELGDAMFVALAGGPARELSVRPTASLTHDQLDRFVGTYDSEVGLTLVMTRDGDTLTGQAIGQPSWTARPVSETTVVNRAAGIEATFEFAQPGEASSATGIVLKQGPLTIRFERVSRPAP